MHTDPTIAASASSLRYRPALDGLRGLAVLAVVAFHFDALPGGYLAVDLFFVLSGFLITSLLLVEIVETGSIRLRAFWSRRARRLLPALFSVIAAGAIYARFWASPTELPTIRREGLAGLAYVSNWAQIGANADYFDQFGAPSIFRHLWSLAIEEQFYVLWPLIVAVIAWRSSRPVRTIAVVSGVGAAISMGLAMLLFQSGTPTDRIYYGTDTRVGAIFLGSVVACLVRRAEGSMAWPTDHAGGAGQADDGDRSRPQRMYPSWTSTISWITFAGLLVAWIVLDGKEPFLWRGGLALCGLGAAAVITIEGSLVPSSLGRLLANPLLVRFGLISYGLYLWHWPVRVFLTEDRTSLSGIALFVLRLGVSVALATVSYFAIERPIRRGSLNQKFGPIRLSAAMAVGVPCLVGALVLMGTNSSQREAGSVEIAQLLAQPDHALPSVAPLLTPGTEPRVLLMGDSVGQTVGQGIATLGQQHGFESANSAVSGCALILETGEYLFDGEWYPDEPGCTKVVELFDEMVASFKPNMVLFVYGRFWDPQRKFADGRTLSPCEPEYDRWREETWTTILTHAKASGIPIAVTTAGYYRGALPTEGADAQTDCMNASTIAAAEQVGVRVVDLGQWTCPTQQCVKYVGGNLLRVDGLHFDKATEPVAAKWILDEVLDRWQPPDPG